MTEKEVLKLIDDFGTAALRAGQSNGGVCFDPGASALWDYMQKLRRKLQEQARAADWSPPIESRLRAVEKCNGVNHKMGMNPYDKDCLLCDNKGTITRPLTPAETTEVAENIFRNARVDTITLPSGLKVILVEGEDAKATLPV